MMLMSEMRGVVCLFSNDFIRWLDKIWVLRVWRESDDWVIGVCVLVGLGEKGVLDFLWCIVYDLNYVFVLILILVGISRNEWSFY